MKELRTAEQERKIVGENLSKLLEAKGKTQADLARELGIAETTVSSWVKGKKYPRIDKQQLLADYFGVTRSDITEKKADNVLLITPKVQRIPLLGAIACGDPITAEQNIEKYMYEFSEGLPKGNLFFLEAKGDSMEPTIANGSYVLIREQAEVENGEIAAVLVDGDNFATLKRIKKQGNVVVLMPDNNNHEPIIVTGEVSVRIIGKAIRVIKNL